MLNKQYNTIMKKEKVKVPTVTHNIRISQRDYEYFLRESNNVSINRGVINLAHMMQLLESNALKNLVGLFEIGEWQYMALVFRIAPLTDELRLDKGLVNQAIRTAYTADTLTEKYDVDLEHLTLKVLGLTRLETYALCNRIRDFWLTNPNWESTAPSNIHKFNVWASY